MNFEFLDQVTVEFLDCTGDDDTVIDAARISTMSDGKTKSMSDDEKYKFINFLMKNRHGSPFEHVIFRFRIEVPIFTVRELMRHRIASYNEESGRYTQMKPRFYTINSERKIIQVGKPGAYTFELGTLDQYELVNKSIEKVSTIAYTCYHEMLDAGIAKEVARMILPLNLFTSLYMTINARSLMNLLSLRIHDDNSMFPSFPQREIEMMAEQMDNIFAIAAPLTHRAFVANGRVAP